MHKQARETRGPQAGKDVLCARASQHYGFGMKIAVYSNTGWLGTTEGFSKQPLLCPKGPRLSATRGRELHQQHRGAAGCPTVGAHAVWLRCIFIKPEN